jgi:hypothetical protein
VVAGDEEHDRLAAMLIADMEMAEPAEKAEADSTAAIESVAADAVIDLGLSQTR